MCFLCEHQWHMARGFTAGHGFTAGQVLVGLAKGCTRIGIAALVEHATAREWRTCEMLHSQKEWQQAWRLNHGAQRGKQCECHGRAAQDRVDLRCKLVVMAVVRLLHSRKSRASYNTHDTCMRSVQRSRELLGLWIVC